MNMNIERLRREKIKEKGKGIVRKRGKVMDHHNHPLYIAQHNNNA